MLKVGHCKVPYKDGERTLGYDLVFYEPDGFADPKKYTPSDFDICLLITEEGKRRTGWWTGQEYWGHRLSRDEVIVGWRKCRELN